MTIPRALVIASFVLWVVSCCVPALTFVSFKGSDTWPGIGVLAMGWMAAFYGQLAWYANLFWLIGSILVLIGRPLAGRIASGLAVLLLANCATIKSLRIPEDESGSSRTAAVQSLGPGFYIWAASIVVLLIAALLPAGASASAGPAGPMPPPVPPTPAPRSY